MSLARVAATSRSISASGIANRRDGHDERVEIVVIVLAFGVMVRGTRAQIVLRRRANPKQDVGADRALARGRYLDGSRHGACDLRLQRLKLALVDEIDLVEHDEIGAHELILIDLLERIVVVERRIGRALLGDTRRIVGETALGDRGGVHHCDDPVDREPVRRSGQSKALMSGLGKASPEVSTTI